MRQRLAVRSHAQIWQCRREQRSGFGVVLRCRRRAKASFAEAVQRNSIADDNRVNAGRGLHPRNGQAAVGRAGDICAVELPIII